MCTNCNGSAVTTLPPLLIARCAATSCPFNFRRTSTSARRESLSSVPCHRACRVGERKVTLFQVFTSLFGAGVAKLQVDKKNAAGQIRCVMLNSIGTCLEYPFPVAKEVVSEASRLTAASSALAPRVVSPVDCLVGLSTSLLLLVSSSCSFCFVVFFVLCFFVCFVLFLCFFFVLFFLSLHDLANSQIS